MVYGLDKFKEYFGDFTDQYVFIGGVACDILLRDAGASFRGTKDLDIVLVIEALSASFGKKFWKFIEDGGYVNRQKNSGKEQFYRFEKPSVDGFPIMVELFSRKTKEVILDFDSHFVPIHIDESIISLSAILLNDVYYEILINGKIVADGFSVLNIETLILFKIKAWLDLKSRKLEDVRVNGKNIKKHKNDIFRLLEHVSPSNTMKIHSSIERDVKKFLKLIQDDKPDLKNLGIRGVSLEEMLTLLRSVYLGLK